MGINSTFFIGFILIFFINFSKAKIYDLKKCNKNDQLSDPIIKDNYDKGYIESYIVETYFKESIEKIKDENCIPYLFNGINPEQCNTTGFVKGKIDNERCCFISINYKDILYSYCGMIKNEDLPNIDDIIKEMERKNILPEDENEEENNFIKIKIDCFCKKLTFILPFLVIEILLFI